MSYLLFAIGLYLFYASCYGIAVVTWQILKDVFKSLKYWSS